MEHEHPHPTGPTFDTLKAAEALQQAGFTGVQARAVTQTIVESQDTLATKADLREHRAAAKADLRELQTEMKAEFKAQRADSKRMEETLRAEMASLQADTKADIKALRADNKRMEETLRAEIQGLKDSISMLRWVILGALLPLALGAAANLIGAVVARFMS